MDSADRQPPTLLVKNARPEPVPGTVTLDADVRRHVKALRLRGGDPVHITDGRGSKWKGRLGGRAGDGSLSCSLEDTLPVQHRSPIALGFGVGAKARTLWLVEKAVELGAGTLQPVEFARSASVADAARSPSFWRKAERRAEAALEQSGGAWLPDLRDPVTLDAFLDAAAPPADPRETSADRLILTADADVELSEALAEWNGLDALYVLVGPEGGIEPAEMQAALAGGFEPAGFGPRTLRFETAAIAALAVASQRAAVCRRNTYER